MLVLFEDTPAPTATPTSTAALTTTEQSLADIQANTLLTNQILAGYLCMFGILVGIVLIRELFRGFH